jgi:hypothetical protein
MEASPFYRGGKVVRVGGGQRVMEVKCWSLMVDHCLVRGWRGGRVKEGH